MTARRRRLGPDAILATSSRKVRLAVGAFETSHDHRDAVRAAIAIWWERSPDDGAALTAALAAFEPHVLTGTKDARERTALEVVKAYASERADELPELHAHLSREGKDDPAEP